MTVAQTVSPEDQKMLSGITEELQEFYRTTGQFLTVPDAMLEIERRWGSYLLRNFCIPRGLGMGACLVVALEIAKQ